MLTDTQLQWNAQQKVFNNDRHLADPVMFAGVLREVQAEIESEMERTTDRRDRERNDFKCHALTQELKNLQAERTVLLYGPDLVGVAISGRPDRLLQRLAARGVTPLPGCSHVFERRGGLLMLEQIIADLREQRAAAMAVLV